MKTMLKVIFTILVLLLQNIVKADSALIAQQKILFGSCAHQDKSMPILKSINREKADLFIFLGDNVYGDTEDMKQLSLQYEKLASIPGIKTLKENTSVIAIWDDHDFGENDAGSEYPKKSESRKIMLDFFNEPDDSPRRNRNDGIYTSYLYGNEGKKIHVILPDLRWNRTSLLSVSPSEYRNIRIPKKMGPYLPNTDRDSSMLGKTQWQWLEQQLQIPSSIKIIASSLQLLPEFTGWESWANYPKDRQRLIDLINEYQINGVIIISGDTHWGEISKVQNLVGYPLWEVTSSGLTEEWKSVSPNRHRVGDYTNHVNYGEILIDWQAPDPIIRLGLKDVLGKVIHQQKIHLSDISPYKKG